MKTLSVVISAAALSMLSMLILPAAQAQNGSPGQNWQGTGNGDLSGQQPSGPQEQGNGGGQWGGNNPERQQRRQRMLEQFDANHDGQLDENERAQMRAWMQQRRQNGGGQFGGGQPGNGSNGSAGSPRMQQMLQRFDANHDGTLDDAERAKMRSWIQQRRQMRQQSGGGPGGMMPGGAPGNGPGGMMPGGGPGGPGGFPPGPAGNQPGN